MSGALLARQPIQVGFEQKKERDKKEEGEEGVGPRQPLCEKGNEQESLLFIWVGGNAGGGNRRLSTLKRSASSRRESVQKCNTAPGYKKKILPRSKRTGDGEKKELKATKHPTL